jgi:hypothetical protein
MYKVKLVGGPMNGRSMEVAGEIPATQFPVVSQLPQVVAVYVREDRHTFKYVGLRKRHPTKSIMQEYDEGLLNPKEVDEETQSEK